MERIQKVISNSGYCSRRKAEELILSGVVKVNGEIVQELGTKVASKDVITIQDKEIKKDIDNKVYYLLNKPRGVISSASDEHSRKTVVDLIETDKRIYPVGRLDYDTTGVLILTNDGELTNGLTHPKNNIDKVYLAKLEGIITGGDITKLKYGVMIDNHKCIPSRVKLKRYSRESKTSLVEITIHEGHNHQVKKMFEAINYNVIRLTRTKVGFLTVNDLKSGEYRLLNPKEVKRLYSLIKKSVE